MLTDDQFDRFARVIRRHSGIELPRRKAAVLESRVNAGMRAEGIGDVERYYRHLMSAEGSRPRRRLIDSVTTNETSFFRTGRHFDWLASTYLPRVRNEARRGSREKKLSIWSAACSVGAEPFSIAMTLHCQRALMSDWRIDILGTDISECSLDAAREGFFKSRLLSQLPSGWLGRYFDPADESLFRLKSSVRQMVRFERHNLLDDPPGRRFDLVFLRNVLIYFDETTKQTVLDRTVDAMAPGASLVVGPSEGIYGLKHPLEKVSTFLYRRHTRRSR